MNKLKLPMRDGVGVIILNKKNEVFVGKRKDNPINKWQMPQGGVDENESFLTAMKRELYEETSIKNIEIIKEATKNINSVSSGFKAAKMLSAPGFAIAVGGNPPLK